MGNGWNRCSVSLPLLDAWALGTWDSCTKSSCPGALMDLQFLFGLSMEPVASLPPRLGLEATESNSTDS